MYAPDSQQGIQPFLSNTGIDPTFQKLSDDLANGKFTSVQQRHDMMAQALPLAMKDSLQVWLIDGLSYSAQQKNVVVTNDVGAGIESSPMNPFNMRFADKEGGQLKIGTNDLFTEPWNTLAGSNWVWDTAVMRDTTSGSDLAAAGGLVGDPFTGLAWPQRIDKAEVTVQDRPAGQQDPRLGDAEHGRYDHCAARCLDRLGRQGAEVHHGRREIPERTDRQGQERCDLSGRPVHHGEVARWQPPVCGRLRDARPSSSSIAPTKTARSTTSRLVPYFQSVQQSFKGFRITSTNPLTIESYSDLYYSDAELDVVTGWPNSPVGLQGEIAGMCWQSPNLAEAAGELAYTPDKADANKIEQTSWVGGPSLDILSKHLDEAESQSLIPYAPTLASTSQPDEAKARYDNLKKWYTDHGTFWIGTGPYYLDKVFTTEKTLVLKNNPGLPGSGGSLVQLQHAEAGYGSAGWPGTGEGWRYGHL